MKLKPSSMALIFVLLIFAAVLQIGVAPGLTFGAVSPDFLLLALALTAIRAGKIGGLLIGFFDGLLIGAVSGANIQHYILGRTLAGWLIGSLADMEFDQNLLLAFIVSVISVLVSQFLLMFFAPPLGVIRFIGVTLSTAVYNGVLAVPVYALLKRISDPNSRVKF